MGACLGVECSPPTLGSPRSSVLPKSWASGLPSVLKEGKEGSVGGPAARDSAPPLEARQGGRFVCAKHHNFSWHFTGQPQDVGAKVKNLRPGVIRFLRRSAGAKSSRWWV